MTAITGELSKADSFARATEANFVCYLPVHGSSDEGLGSIHGGECHTTDGSLRPI
jgi:hypothetical protein